MRGVVEKNRDNWAQASEISLSENNKCIETKQGLLAGKIRPSESVKGHRPTDSGMEGKKKNPGGL